MERILLVYDTALLVRSGKMVLYLFQGSVILFSFLSNLDLTISLKGLWRVFWKKWVRCRIVRHTWYYFSMSMLFCKEKPYIRKKKTLCLARSAEGKVWCDVTRGALAAASSSHQCNANGYWQGSSLSSVSSSVSSSNLKSHLSEHEEEVVEVPNMYNMYK